MHRLLSIGQFAQLTGLTIKALRLYDRHDVLRPALVDLNSGFRYYSPDQVVSARQIRLLRALDMPLSEIRLLVQAQDHAAGRALLTQHTHRIEARIVGYQHALAALHSVQAWYERTGKVPSMERKPDTIAIIDGPNGVLFLPPALTVATGTWVEWRNDTAEPQQALSSTSRPFALVPRATCGLVLTRAGIASWQLRANAHVSCVITAVGQAEPDVPGEPEQGPLLQQVPVDIVLRPDGAAFDPAALTIPGDTTILWSNHTTEPQTFRIGRRAITLAAQGQVTGALQSNPTAPLTIMYVTAEAP